MPRGKKGTTPESIEGMHYYKNLLCRKPVQLQETEESKWEGIRRNKVPFRNRNKGEANRKSKVNWEGRRFNGVNEKGKEA